MTIVPLNTQLAGGLASTLVKMDPWLTLGYRATTLESYLKQDDSALARMMLLDEKGEILGLIAVREKWLRGPYIELLAVLPSAQGKGVGRGLINWAIGMARPNLWVCVSEFNTRARGFYARQGFHEIARLPDLVMPGANEILLRYMTPHW